MKAAVCREFGAPLTVEEARLDPPQMGEVTVKIAACAVCHSDITYMQGGWGGALPAVYGHEAAGIVETVGPGVAGIDPGDHVVVTLIRCCGSCHYCLQGKPVLCEGRFRLDAEGPIHTPDGQPLHQAMRTGAFAERVTVHASQMAVIPKDVPLDCASLLACGVITGLGAVFNTAQVPAGADVVVIGTGGVGIEQRPGRSTRRCAHDHGARSLRKQARRRAPLRRDQCPRSVSRGCDGGDPAADPWPRRRFHLRHGRSQARDRAGLSGTGARRVRRHRRACRPTAPRSPSIR